MPNLIVFEPLLLHLQPRCPFLNRPLALAAVLSVNTYEVTWSELPPYASPVVRCCSCAITRDDAC